MAEYTGGEMRINARFRHAEHRPSESSRFKVDAYVIPKPEPASALDPVLRLSGLSEI